MTFVCICDTYILYHGLCECDQRELENYLFFFSFIVSITECCVRGIGLSFLLEALIIGSCWPYTLL